MHRRLSSALVGLIALAALVAAGCGGGGDTAGNLTPQRQDINATQLQTMLDDGAPLQLVDVRTAAEYADEHIPGAVNIPVEDIKGPVEDLAALDRDVRTAVYCSSGNRSLTAADALLGLGFTDVYNLLGGLNPWPGELEDDGCGCG